MKSEKAIRIRVDNLKKKFRLYEFKIKKIIEGAGGYRISPEKRDIMRTFFTKMDEIDGELRALNEVLRGRK